jgi:hypothetical protein
MGDQLNPLPPGVTQTIVTKDRSGLATMIVVQHQRELLNCSR